MRRHLPLMLAALLLVLPSCAGQQPVAPPPTGLLTPGGTVVGVDGVSLTALDGALANAVAVSIARVPSKTIAAPLPEGLSLTGHAYQVAATVDTTAGDDAPFGFVVGLPLPASANPKELNVAFLIRRDRVELWYPDYVDGDVWELVPGVFDPTAGRWLVTLHALPAAGTELGLVEGDYFVDATATLDDTRTASDVGFHVRCRKSDDPAICGDAPKDAYAAALEDAFDTFAGLYFAEPKIRRRYEVTGAPTAYLYGFTFKSDGTRKCNWSKAPAYYNPVTANIVVCLDGDGFTAARESTTWHEFFHATQFGYGIMLDPVVKRHWILEGTAVFAESVLELIGAGQNPALRPPDRMAGRTLRVVDRGLLEHGDGLEYHTQDFWVFIGKAHDRGFNYLRSVFDRGISRSAVDEALQAQFSGWTLSEAYWAWVKNQAFEKSVDLGGTAFSQRPRCAFDDRMATPEVIDYAPATTPFARSFSLPYLTSMVIELAFEPGPFDYAASVAVSAQHEQLQVKYYEPSQAGYFGCHTEPDSRSHLVSVPRDEGANAHVLVSNTRTSGSSVDVELRIDPASELELEILEPQAHATLDEGELRFTAALTGPGVDTAVIHWSEDGRRIGSGASIETTSLCPGSRTVRAEANVFDLGFTPIGAVSLTAVAEVSLTVNKLPPVVSISTEPLPTTIGAGDYLALNGWARETVCGEPPTAQHRLRWRDGDGNLLGSGPGLLALATGMPGDRFEVVLEYEDDFGTKASDAVSVELTEPPPGGYSPRAVIDDPRDGAYFWPYDTTVIALHGRAADPEDGVLSGEALRWYTRHDGAVDWNFIGTGNHAVLQPVGGRHEIRLIATDSNGNTGEAIIGIFYIVLG